MKIGRIMIYVKLSMHIYKNQIQPIGPIVSINVLDPDT